MNILSVSGVSKIGREAPLFTDVSFGMNEGEKAALIGRNGTGKSTLLKTIAGLLVPDAGRITVSNSAGISYLPQNHDFCADDTIRAHIFKSLSPKLEIIRESVSIRLIKNVTTNCWNLWKDRICGIMKHRYRQYLVLLELRICLAKWEL